MDPDGDVWAEEKNVYKLYKSWKRGAEELSWAEARVEDKSDNFFSLLYVTLMFMNWELQLWAEALSHAWNKVRNLFVW